MMKYVKLSLILAASAAVFFLLVFWWMVGFAYVVESPHLHTMLQDAAIAHRSIAYIAASIGFGYAALTWIFDSLSLE